MGQVKGSPTAVACAWAAGLFDGEGSVSLHFSRTRARDHSVAAAYRFMLRVGMTDVEPLNRLRSQFGGSITGVRPTLAGRPHSVWYVGGERAVKTARQLLPYATVKRERLRLFIEAWERKRELGHVSLGPGSGRGSHRLNPAAADLLADYSARISALNQKGPRGATVLPELSRRSADREAS